MSRRPWSIERLLAGVRAGEPGALARAITLVENRDPAAYALVRELYPETGHAHAVGFTGPPGVGKSSLIAALVRRLREQGKTVGVVSVDPSSPFTRGALLGDRIRLTDHFLDPGVFIRSMGTRGHVGGLAESTLQALLILDASGKDVVFLETVGSGQSDVGVLSIADTVVLALLPGSGDSVQALKAGIMEIPDVIAINKADHPQARATANDVRRCSRSRRRRRSRRSCSPRRCAARGSPSSGTRSRGTRSSSRRPECSRSAGARTSRPRCSPSHRRGRGGTSRAPSGTTRSCGGCSTASNAASSIRSQPCVRSSVRCSTSPMATRTIPTLNDIQAARDRIGDRARSTAVYGSDALSDRTGRECLQGREPPAHRLVQDPRRGEHPRRAREAERAAGVIAASAGNHGQAVARAARELGTRATIVMPQDAPMSKVEPTLRYGGEAVLFGATFDDALAEALRRVEETGATFVHAFEDERVIAGQGTIGLELAEQLPDLETLLIPVGGGGLAAGISIAMRALRPEVRLVGVRSSAASTRSPTGSR